MDILTVTYHVNYCVYYNNCTVKSKIAFHKSSNPRFNNDDNAENIVKFSIV